MKRKNILLLLTLLLNMVSAKVMGQECVDGIHYYLSGTSATVTYGYPGDYNKEAYKGHVIIPEKITYREKQYSVTGIGESAFKGCTGLTSITIPNSVTYIGNRAFYGCTSLTSVIIPNSVASINEFTFSGCTSLASVTIPNSVTTIVNRAFYCCTGLTSVIIPNSVSSIEESTFLGCTSLVSVTIPNSVTSIGESAFEHCTSLTSITIPNSVTSIGRYAFCRCTGLTSVTIPNSVTTIKADTFYGCTSLASIIIPNSVTSIETINVFHDCSNLEQIVVSSGNTVYDSRDNSNAIIVTATNELILGCKNTVIPNSVTSIGWNAFNSCIGLTSITIPNSVTSIGWHAFSNCTSLTSVTIPNSVTSIGDYAFKKCDALVSVVLGREKPVSINNNVFRSVTNTRLYVPKNSKALYSNKAVWKDFDAIIEYPDPDVNQDSSVDVVDVVDIARHVVGIPSAQFDNILADLNQDKTVSVADALLVVKEIVGETNWARRFNGVSDNRGVLTLTCNDDRSLSLCMEDDGQYTAFQFDLMVPEDCNVQMQLNTLRRQGHQLIYNKVGDGHYRVVALSLNNNAFGGQQGEVLNIQLDGLDGRSVTFDNIHFVTLRGTDHRFDALSSSGATTGVHGASAREQGASAVYRLDGTKQKGSQHGINIVRGKKYMER